MALNQEIPSLPENFAEVREVRPESAEISHIQERWPEAPEVIAPENLSNDSQPNTEDVIREAGPWSGDSNNQVIADTIVPLTQERRADAEADLMSLMDGFIAGSFTPEKTVVWLNEFKEKHGNLLN